VHSTSKQNHPMTIYSNKKSISIAFLIFCSFLFNTSIFAQTTKAIKPQKSRFFAYLGWNRAIYTKSNLHLQGIDYDFTLFDVVGKDEQYPFDPKVYFHPSKITIPQTNMRFGYFYNKKNNISFGLDHMKYVLQQNQMVKITGEISELSTDFGGVYVKDDIVIVKEFLKYEHTDGLNYFNFEWEHIQKSWEINQIRTKISFSLGVGAGALIPRSDVRLFRNDRHDKYHLAGYGTNVKMGFNVTFFKCFFLQNEWKGGFIHLSDVRTTYSKADKASQKFGFLQRNFLFGGNFLLGR
jgi:hypothetical protein